MYLNDQDLIKAFCRCRDNLTKGEEGSGKTGLIFVKENVKASGAYLDKSDYSLVRSEAHFRAIFATCGLDVLHRSQQPGWDPSLLPLGVWVLRPRVEPTVNKQSFFSKNLKVNAVADKLCNRVVRVEIADGRQYIGLF